MELTKVEKEMLEGVHGNVAQRSMEVLLAVGEAFDAERMVPIKSAHLVGANPISAGKGGKAFIKEMEEKGGRFVVPTTTNPTCLDPWSWRDMGIGEETYQEFTSLAQSIARMGGFLCNTCIPYLIGHAPRMREHVAWGESSAVLYANAVLGARTNREGGPTALAAAITGRTPFYGYHLDENRYGEVLIINNVDLRCDTDYATLGYFIGKMVRDKVPIINGIPSSISQDEIKSLGMSLGVTGSVTHYHVVGVTPEAITEEMASGYKKISPSNTFQFGLNEAKEIEESLSVIDPNNADLVILGCPHASITQLKKYAEAFYGRKVKNNIEIWILTSNIIKKYAKDIGIADILESTGVRLVSNTCPPAMPRDFLRKRGCTGIITDSPKMVYYVSTINNIPCCYGSLTKFIDSVASKIY